jgi:hypothetical protein
MNPQFAFAPATKELARARVALTGPYGSGKTYTGLKMITAFADGARPAVIDTERGSASKYADEFAFDALNLTDFHPQTLIKAVKAAENAGYPALMIDSFSHFWSGQNGVIDQADNMATGNNSFSGWKHVRPLERQMMDTILDFPGDVIVCMRSKVAYEVQTNSKGKKEPVKLGLKPDQREGIEYEMDIVGDMADGTLTITKSRAVKLTGAVVPLPGEEFAAEIMTWLRNGVASPAAAEIAAKALADDVTVGTLRDLHKEATARGLLGAIVEGPKGETGLGLLIIQRGKALADAEKAGAGDAAA